MYGSTLISKSQPLCRQKLPLKFSPFCNTPSPMSIIKNLPSLHLQKQEQPMTTVLVFLSDQRQHGQQPFIVDEMTINQWAKTFFQAEH